MKKPEKLYPKMMDIYNEFIKSKVGVPAKIDGAEGKAMKAIIRYLTQIADGDEQKALDGWKILLSLHNRWDKFRGQQLKLTQINSNLINIISDVKRGNTKLSEEGLDQAFAQRAHREAGARSSGAEL